MFKAMVGAMRGRAGQGRKVSRQYAETLVVEGKLSPNDPGELAFARTDVRLSAKVVREVLVESERVGRFDLCLAPQRFLCLSRELCKALLIGRV